jgi:hypothetical protein
MIQWRPSPGEERWLAVIAELGAAVPHAPLADRTGGWRSTGALARIALFALGFIAAALLFGVLGIGSETMLLVAGLAAALAAEWLTVGKRLYASGIEEGLTVAGALMIGLWIAVEILPAPDGGDTSQQALVLIVALGAAGLRRLNAFVTACAVVGFVYWIDSTGLAAAFDAIIGDGMTAFAAGIALAALALWRGGREHRRPSHDRMLDWLAAALPLFAYAQLAGPGAFDASGATSDHGASRVVTVLMLLSLGAMLLVTGLRRRRHAPLWGFLGCVAGLATELHAAIPLTREAWLIACGLVALIAGAWLDRRLRQPRNGLTSASLTRGEGPLDLLQMAGSALLAQRAAPQASPVEPGFEGGGGKFGGGGSSGRY